MPAIPDIPKTLPCKVMIVGEALGAEEDNAGRVFIGPSGRLLDSMLCAAGLATRNLDRSVDRSELYITNVFMKRPRNNVIDHFFVKKGQARKDNLTSPYQPYGTKGIVRPDLVAEVERLAEEIRRASPRVIIALGGTALWALTGQTKISSFRGVALPCTLVPGLKVLPTYHPAAVLREYSARPTVIADLIKARNEAAFPDIRRRTRSIWIADTVGDLELFERLHLAKSNTIACDVETEAAQITHICVAASPSACLVVPIWNKNKPGYHHWSEADELSVKRWLNKILTDRRYKKVFHNATYDLTYLAEEGILCRGDIDDTMLIHHSLQIELPKSLGFLGSLYTTEAAWKEMRVRAKKDITKKDE